MDDGRAQADVILYKARWCFVALLIALLTGCEPTPPDLLPTTQFVSTTQPSPRPADHNAVLVAVFRHQLGGPADFYFLSLDEKADPPQEVLSAFAGHVPPVFPISLAVVSANGVMHMERDGVGRVFRVIEIAWRDADTAEVMASWFASGLSAEGYVYRVERREGKWAVTKSDIAWVA